MANSKSKAVEGPKKSQQTLVNEFISAQGSKGATAQQIAEHIQVLQPDMEQSDRAKALKKVRVLARKATGGASQSRDGRSAIYVINA